MSADLQDLALLSVEGGVARITLNRPDRGNGWTDSLGGRYFELLDIAARDPEVRAILVTGAGRSFCVGGDSDALQDLTSEAIELVERPYWFPFSIGKPVVAAINGACFGIGLQQALCCDIRIAADDAKFSTAYARRGLVAEYGMSWVLPRLIGIGHAMDMLMSARLVRAAEAERIGLVNRIVPAADLLDHAMAYAADMARHCSPRSMRDLKRQCYADLTKSLRASYGRSESMLDEALGSEDFREGVRSWQDRRPPVFTPLAAVDALIDVD
jgi:enoyl-CoA hydratase/carnithine racemase